MNKRYTTLAIAAISLLSQSCQREEESGRGQADATLTFAPSVTAIRAMEGGAPTKGTPLNVDGSEGAFPAGRSFFVSGWSDASTPANIIPGTAGLYQEVKLKGTEWNTVYTDGGVEYCKEYLWKPGETKTFYAYANLPEDGASVTNEDATGQTLSYAVPESVDAQTDILLGFYTGDGRTGPSGSEKMTGTATLKFAHPLTGVCFKLGTVSGTASFEVNSIAVEGIYASGSVTQNAGNPLAADWSGCTGSITVSQSVSTQPTAAAPEIGGTFLLIPQTFAATSGARIAVSCTVDGAARTLYSPLGGETWTAGTLYSYTIDYNGHEGIQLWEDGPYWSSKNVGATRAEDYGWYFAWGETTGYVTANVSPTPVQPDQQTYKCDFVSVVDGSTRTKGFYEGSYNFPGAADITTASGHDAAYENSGIKWRIPTKAECEALVSNTDMTYTTRNGVKGFLFTGRGGYSRRSIFIPASGWANGAQISNRGLSAMLWTSTSQNNHPYSMELGYYAAGANLASQNDRNHAGVVAEQHYHVGRAIRAVENTAN